MTPTPGIPGGPSGSRPPLPYPYSPAGIRPGDAPVPPGFPPGVPLHNGAGANVGYARPMVCTNYVLLCLKIFCVDFQSIFGTFAMQIYS